jgi:diadenosine tetraphosphate (Ap4A) HIT family hydrolase
MTGVIKGVTYTPSGGVASCLFCSIIEGKEPARIVLENEEFLAFKTIKPYSSNHLLVVPRKHVKNLSVMSGPEDANMIHGMEAFGKVALGKDADDAQFCFHVPPYNSIDHLHLHCIGARSRMTLAGSLKFWQETFYCWSAKSAAAVVLKRELSKL